MALLAQFVVLPFMEIDIQQFAACIIQNFGEDIAATEMEVIEFQNDLALKSLVSSTECIWPINQAAISPLKKAIYAIDDIPMLKLRGKNAYKPSTEEKNRICIGKSLHERHAIPMKLVKTMSTINF
ncbi:unnamed protein product [Diabrotica balteata]|uniref:Uncharacterized protein n=1 Tax=Diabrotica balteata TaxID=107213 RepID=A0A9N9X9C8_DIABA|nr:unnamed protein product [Diabrotica balteata]